MSEAVRRFRSAFAPSDDLHMNNAGIARCSNPAIAAVTDVAQQQSFATEGFFPLLDRYEEARTTTARLLGTARENTAMMHTAAAALSTVAMGLPMAEGDEVVTWDQEYPSNAYPWYVATRRVSGRVVVVDSEPDLDVDTQKLVDAIGPKTRVVALSWVQYQTGALTELPPVVEACRRHDAVLVVDVAQAAGVLPIDMERDGVDVVCGVSHKWLTGPMGHGYLAFRSQELLQQVTPLEHGAMTYGTPDDLTDPTRTPRPDARRFEPGTPLMLGAIGFGAAVELVLGCGVDALRAESLAVARRLREGLLEQGARLLGKRGDDFESPITTFVPRGELQRTCDALDRAGVAYSPRGGGVRLSPHAYNTSDQVDQVLGVLAEASSS